MPNYKIHIDKPLPSKEEIAKYKNFERLHGQYETATRFQFWRNLRIKPRYFATLVMLLAVGYLVWEASFHPSHTAKPWISPPLEQNLPYVKVSLDADSPIELTIGEKHHFYAAAGSFADASGTPLSGTITLAYRELHDPQDLFIAGVRMRYDSAGNDYLLASGGMVELQAFQDSQEVFLREGAQIRITYLAESKVHRYQAYSLIPKEKTWRFRGVDSVVTVWDEEALLATLPSKPRLQEVQDLNSGDQVSELELIPKGVQPPAQPSGQDSYQEKLAAWDRLYQEAKTRQSGSANYSFTVDHLGYHCLGSVLTAPSSETKVTLTDEAGENLSRSLGKSHQPVWIVQRGLCTLRPAIYDREGSHILSYYPDSATMIWTVTEDGQLAVLQEASWQKQVISAPSRKVVVSLVPGQFASLQDLKAYLGWEREE